MLAAKIRKAQSKRYGQGMTEYIIIVGLIAILLVTAVTQFKDALSNAFGQATTKVDGIAGQISSGE